MEGETKMKFRPAQKVTCINDIKKTMDGDRKILITKGKTYRVTGYDTIWNSESNLITVINDNGDNVPYSEHRFIAFNQWKGKERCLNT